MDGQIGSFLSSAHHAPLNPCRPETVNNIYGKLIYLQFIYTLDLWPTGYCFCHTAVAFCDHWNYLTNNIFSLMRQIWVLCWLSIYLHQKISTFYRPVHNTRYSDQYKNASSTRPAIHHQNKSMQHPFFTYCSFCVQLTDFHQLMKTT